MKLVCNTVVVTRHLALVAFLREGGFLPEQFDVIEHVNDPAQIEGKRVFGILPNRLACLAESITEVALEVPLKKRGVELTLDDMRNYAKAVTTYKVSAL